MKEGSFELASRDEDSHSRRNYQGAKRYHLPQFIFGGLRGTLRASRKTIMFQA